MYVVEKQCHQHLIFSIEVLPTSKDETFLGYFSHYVFGADFVGTFVAMMAATKKSNTILQDERHVQLQQLSLLGN